MPDDFESQLARVEANMVENLKLAKLLFAKNLREIAASSTGQHKVLLLEMADKWEKYATSSTSPAD